MTLARVPRTAACVADAMVTVPKTCRAAVSVAEARAVFDDDHVHALLLVRGRELVAVVRRDDLTAGPDERPAVHLGRLDGRCASPDDDLDTTFRWMIEHRVRRLAVVGADGALLGLLCLKQSQRGFCSDRDVTARARERAAGGRDQ